MKVQLPWPPKALSPNDRVHFAVKAKAAKKYRLECAWACRAAKMTLPETAGPLHLWLTFVPPDRRHRDDDNLVAAFKAGRDGIADFLGVDDKRFVCHPMLSDLTGGFVSVTITAGPTP